MVSFGECFRRAVELPIKRFLTPKTVALNIRTKVLSEYDADGHRMRKNFVCDSHFQFCIVCKRLRELLHGENIRKKHIMLINCNYKGEPYGIAWVRLFFNGKPYIKTYLNRLGWLKGRKFTIPLELQLQDVHFHLKVPIEFQVQYTPELTPT